MARNAAATIKTLLLWLCAFYTMYSIVWIVRSPTAGSDLVAHVKLDYVTLDSVGRGTAAFVAARARSVRSWVLECSRDGNSCLNHRLLQDAAGVIADYLNVGKATVCETFCPLSAEDPVSIDDVDRVSKDDVDREL